MACREVRVANLFFLISSFCLYSAVLGHDRRVANRDRLSPAVIEPESQTVIEYNWEKIDERICTDSRGSDSMGSSRTERCLANGSG